VVDDVVSVSRWTLTSGVLARVAALGDGGMDGVDGAEQASAEGAERASVDGAERASVCDQLTVNEYAAGVVGRCRCKLTP